MKKHQRTGLILCLLVIGAMLSMGFGIETFSSVWFFSTFLSGLGIYLIWKD